MALPVRQMCESYCRPKMVQSPASGYLRPTSGPCRVMSSAITLVLPGKRAKCQRQALAFGDRKSTRLNSSHVAISYAVFCLKKKKYTSKHRQTRDICREATR